MHALNRTAHHRRSADHVNGVVEVSRDISWDPVTLTPFLSVGGMYLREHGYTESGAGSLNLAVRARDHATFQGKAGATLSRVWMMGGRAVYGFMKLGYVHRRGLKRQQRFHARFADQGPDFAVRASRRDLHLLNPGVGMTTTLGCNLFMSCAYEAEVNAHRQSHQALLQLTKRF